jgi:glycosyltransferase involved in cell wall biosynthesis
MKSTVNGNKSNKCRNKIKVQIVSRTILVANAFGNSTYVLDFLKYLHEIGVDTEYLLLDEFPNARNLWYVIPEEIHNVTKLLAMGHFRVGNLLISNSISNWTIESLRFIYNLFIPKFIKNIYRHNRDKKQITPRYIVPAKPWDQLVAPKEIKFVQSQVLRYQPDAVIANYAYLSDIFDGLKQETNILKVILTHDVRHQRTAQFQKLGLDSFEVEWSREKERQALKKAQVLLAIQQEDSNIFQKMAPELKVICMPLAATCKLHDSPQVPGRCLFVGSNADHNYYGLKWFLDNVWIKVLQLYPNSSLHICGNICDLIQDIYPNVSLLGRVEDLKPEYSAAEVCLVPLLAGSGLKIKLVEAMSYGRACVSTSIGIQGLPEILGKTTLVADTADDFANCVYRLLTDSHRRKLMEQEAYQYITDNLSPQSVYQPFIDYIYEHLEQPSQTIDSIVAV